MVAADGSRDTGLVTYSLSSQLQELGLSQSAAQFMTPILTRTAIPGIYSTVQSIENFAMDAIRDGLQSAVQKSASDYGETSRIQWQMLGNGFQGLIKNLMDPYPVNNGGLSNNEYGFAAPASSFASDLNSVLSKVSTPTHEILDFSVGLGEQSAATRINGLMFGIGSQTPSSQNLPVPNWTSGVVVEPTPVTPAPSLSNASGIGVQPTPVQPVPSLSNAAGLGVQSTPVPEAPNFGTAAGIGGEPQLFHEQNWEPAAETGRPFGNYLDNQGLPPVSEWEPAQDIIPSDVRRIFGL